MIALQFKNCVKITILLGVILFLCCGPRYVFRYKPVAQLDAEIPAIYSKLKSTSVILPFTKVNAADCWWTGNDYLIYVATPTGLYISSNSGLSWQRKKITIKTHRYKTDAYGNIIKDEKGNKIPITEKVTLDEITNFTDVAMVSLDTVYFRLYDKPGCYLEKSNEEWDLWKDPSSYDKLLDQLLGSTIGFPEFRLLPQIEDTIVKILISESGFTKENAKRSIHLYTRNISVHQPIYVLTTDYIFKFISTGSSKKPKIKMAKKVSLPVYLRDKEIYCINSGYLLNELWLWTSDGLYISLDDGEGYDIFFKNQKAIEKEIIALIRKADTLEAAGDYVAALNIYNQIVNNYSDSPVTAMAMEKSKNLREKIAAEILKEADNLANKKDYNKALNLYQKICAEYPMTPICATAKDKIRFIEMKLKEEKMAGIRKKLLRVSDAKVRNSITKLGLDEYQNNALAMAIENLPSNTAATVMKEGLGMPLSDDECSAEYRKLTLYQKFYTVICYLWKCNEDLGEQISEEDNFWYLIAGELNISEEMVYKLFEIKPENLLKK